MDAETRREFSALRDAIHAGDVDRATTRANVLEIGEDVKEIKEEAKTTRLMLRSALVGVVVAIAANVIGFSILRAAFGKP